MSLVVTGAFVKLAVEKCADMRIQSAGVDRGPSLNRTFSNAFKREGSSSPLSASRGARSELFF